MRFRIFNTEINISVFFPILVCFMLIVDTTGFMSASLFAVAVHEAGHLIIMRIMKCPPAKIEVSFAGVLISGRYMTDRRENLLILAGGPLANIAAALVFFVLYSVSGKMILAADTVVEAAYAAINLVPVKGLDGGSITEEILDVILGTERSRLIMSVLSVLIAAMTVIAGITLIIKSRNNPSLLLLGIYLVILNIVKAL